MKVFDNIFRHDDHPGEEVHGYRLIFGYIGILLMLIGFITLLPLITILFYPQDIHEAKFFVLPGIGAIFIGYILSFLIRNKTKGHLLRNQDAVIVVTCWILAVFVSALPFVLSRGYTFTQAVFETTSGWSTTGLSVVDVEHTSHLFLMHRSLILFFGGIGLVVIMLSVLSDTYGMRLYQAEGHNDRLLPNLIKSTRLIITIYLGYISAGIILYVICGMPLFDAIIHSIGALSTGGFSNQPDSIAHYNSLSIEIITIILMLLGNISFLAHVYLLRGRFRHFFCYCEIRFQLFLIAFSVPIFAFICMSMWQGAMSNQLRIAFFQVVSALTTTGFQTVSNFQLLPQAVIFLMILLQIIGGGVGSTAGGMKQYRFYLALKSIQWRINEMHYSNKRICTHSVYKVNRKEKISSQEICQNSIFVFLYLLLFFTGSFLLSLWGYPLEQCMFEFSSALSTVGLSMGIMSHDAPTMVLWIGTIGMFLGRLEIYVVLLAISRCQKDGILWFKKMKKDKQSAIIKT